jgi:hypothetical protein
VERAPGAMKPLAIWLVPRGEGLARLVGTPTPNGEGHWVDPPELLAQNGRPVGDA